MQMVLPTSDRILYKKDENFFFVTLLAKYKVLLRAEKNLEFKEKKIEAAKAFANEYNMKCQRKFTVEQIFKKVYNMKGRLKTKTCKNLSRTKKLSFTAWEQKFLDLWVENGRTGSKRSNIGEHVMARQTNSSTSQLPEVTLKANMSDITYQYESYVSENQTDECSSLLLNDESKSECYTSNGFITPANVKIETEEYQVQCTADVHNMAAADSESEREPCDEADNNESYEKMSLKELKRVALIAQIETYKAQKAAAKAQQSAAESQRKAAEVNKQLNEYQFTLIRHQNGDD